MSPAVVIGLVKVGAHVRVPVPLFDNTPEALAGHAEAPIVKPETMVAPAVIAPVVEITMLPARSAPVMVPSVISVVVTAPEAICRFENNPVTSPAADEAVVRSSEALVSPVLVITVPAMDIPVPAV